MRAFARKRAPIWSTALAVLTVLFRDWRSPMAKKALEIIDWYFAEVPQVSKTIGVDAREKASGAV